MAWLLLLLLSLWEFERCEEERREREPLEDEGERTGGGVSAWRLGAAQGGCSWRVVMD